MVRRETIQNTEWKRGQVRTNNPEVKAYVL